MRDYSLIHSMVFLVRIHHTFSKTIGNQGIIDLLKKNRKAKFISIVTYCDKIILKSFNGIVDGTISKSKKGKGWGFDPIFVPNNSDESFGVGDRKNELSHRYKSLKQNFLIGICISRNVTINKTIIVL